jgi:hypothetical protein
MVLNRSRIATAFTAGVVFALAGAAHAQTPLTAGNNTGPAPSVPVIGFLGGTQIGGSSTTFGDSQNGQSIFGTLVSAAFQGGNGADATFIDFYYQFSNAGGSNQAIQSISIASFLNATTAVGQTNSDVDGGGVVPFGDLFTAGGAPSSVAQRSLNGAGILFDYGTGVTQGTFSNTMVIRTNATSFSTNGSAAFLGASGISANSNGLVIAAGSVSSAPEPGSFALLGTGALGMVGMIARRRNLKK